MFFNFKDSHGPGLRAIVDGNQLVMEEAIKVLACRHASSSSATQQSADVGRQFAVIKECNKTTTSINSPSGYGLKGSIKNKLDKLRVNGILLLKLPARKAIIDHCVSCPEIYGKAMQPKTTKKVSFIM